MDIETRIDLNSNQVETAEQIAEFVRSPENHIHAQVDGFVLRIVKTNGKALEQLFMDAIIKRLQDCDLVADTSDWPELDRTYAYRGTKL